MTRVKTKTNYSFHYTLPHHISTIFNFIKERKGVFAKDRGVMRHKTDLNLYLS